MRPGLANCKEAYLELSFVQGIARGETFCHSVPIFEGPIVYKRWVRFEGFLSYYLQYVAKLSKSSLETLWQALSETALYHLMLTTARRPRHHAYPLDTHSYSCFAYGEIEGQTG